jgi:uncharacterized protein
VQFLLQFEPPPPAPPGAVEPTPESPEAASDEPAGEDGSKIVSLDQFRKK